MSKEAMKLALEALETERENYQDWDKQDGAPEYIYEAITALREALAERPAQQHIEHCLWARNGNTPCPHVQPAQQEQGPVAWRDPTNANPGQGCTYIKARAERSPHIYKQALYTSPPAQPSKPWVRLTPEQRATIAEANNMLVDDDLFDAIEAKLKEKNT